MSLGKVGWSALVAAGAVLVTGSLLLVTRGDDGSVEIREVSTARGQTEVLYLPDSSRVTLGPESRLGVPANTGSTRSGTPREVYLEGEAYLEVQRDSTRPFLVYTAAGIVQDNGSAFLVVTYPEVHGMRVVVASGRVALYQPPSPVRTPLLTLVRGDLAELRPSGIVGLTPNVDVTRYLAWTQGYLAHPRTGPASHGN